MLSSDAANIQRNFAISYFIVFLYLRLSVPYIRGNFQDPHRYSSITSVLSKYIERTENSLSFQRQHLHTK